MNDTKRRFIELAIEYKVLKFGEFTLKSGRISPYFFNAGFFNDSRAIAEVASAYAETIKAHFNEDEIDVLFGPAYKGIPLATAAAMALYQKFKINIPYAFNRKEAKDHGEGGVLVGAPIAGQKVLLLDDVITAGTAIRQSAELFTQENANFHAAVILLDRQEKGKDTQASAVQQAEEALNIRVVSVITLDDLVEYLEKSGDPTLSNYHSQLADYRKKYGINSLPKM